jgi:YidC/Oxa1 family membrane protein insertase
VDKRSLITFGVCMALFLLWTGVISPWIWPPRKTPPAAAPPPAGTPAPQAPGVTPGAPPTVPPPSGAEKQPVFAPEPPFVIETKTFKVEFTNMGAGIHSLVLRFPDENSEVKMLQPLEPGIPHMAVRQVDGPDRIETIGWRVDEKKPGESIKFSYPLRNGITIGKEFRFDPTTYTFTLFITLDPPKGEDGKPPAERTVQLDLLAFNGLEHETPYRYEQYFRGIALVGDDVEGTWDLSRIGKGEGLLVEGLRMPLGPERDIKLQKAWDLLSVPRKEGTIRRWFGLRNRFFTALLLPESSTAESVQSVSFRPTGSNVVKTEKNINAFLRTVPFKITTQSPRLKFTAYAGPIQKDALEQMEGASKILTYGGGCFIVPGGLTNLVGQVILSILKLISGLLNSWGLGIIATTFLIRCCLFPLSKKSQESAYKMQQLAPRIQLLRERYKDDQQKFGLEQMRLFKENKINPLAGCLPLFLQLPIFIGMFSVFDTSIELRKQRFLWFDDLSRPDRLFHWSTPFHLPILGTFDSFNLLPILMLVTWFLQAYFAPRSPDPNMAQQQKMMMAMPIVFGLMCYNYAAGLSLYFLVNSGLAMLEQRLIKKYILKIPPGGQGPAPGTGVAGV